MILHDLHVRGPCLGPTEADPVALVDPDAVLPLPITDQSFEPVSWWHAQVIEPFHRIELESGERVGITRFKVKSAWR